MQRIRDIDSAEIDNIISHPIYSLIFFYKRNDWWSDQFYQIMINLQLVFQNVMFFRIILQEKNKTNPFPDSRLLLVQIFYQNIKVFGEIDPSKKQLIDVLSKCKRNYHEDFFLNSNNKLYYRGVSQILKNTINQEVKKLTDLSGIHRNFENSKNDSKKEIDYLSINRNSNSNNKFKINKKLNSTRNKRKNTPYHISYYKNYISHGIIPKKRITGIMKEYPKNKTIWCQFPTEYNQNMLRSLNSQPINNIRNTSPKFESFLNYINLSQKCQKFIDPQYQEICILEPAMLAKLKIFEDILKK